MSGLTKRFAANILWTWMGVAANLFLGFALSPIIIRRLGEERYGIWTLTFATVEYLSLFDLGLRSAVVNGVASYQARGDMRSVNEVFNSAFGYYLSIAGLIAALVGLGYSHTAAYFHIQPVHVKEFEQLLLLAGLQMTLNTTLLGFQASLEAMQQFKSINRNYVLSMVMRSILCLVVLWCGGGLVWLGIVTVASGLTSSFLNAFSLRRFCPEIKINPRLMNRQRLRSLMSFGAKTLGSSGAQMVLTQAPLIIVGRMMQPAFVGFYSLPSRLLFYAVDAIARIGFITSPNTAEQIALGRKDRVVQLGMYLNRYCLALFIPFALFVLLWGHRLILHWMGPKFAAESVPLLPAFVTGTVLATAAQFNSSSILFGMARHGSYAKVLIVEAVAFVAIFPFVLERFGLVGAAWSGAILMILSRGIATPWVLCRALEFPLHQYMAAIYLRPGLTAVILSGWGLLIKNYFLPGDSIFQLISALAVMGLAQLVLIYLICLDGQHRQMAIETARTALSRIKLTGKK